MAGSTAAAAMASPESSYTYRHPHNDKFHFNTKQQFSVLIYAHCNLLFLVEAEINCLRVGFPNPDCLPLAPALPWASNQANQGHNLFELKAKKIVLPKSLFVTSHFGPTVYYHCQYNSTSQCGHICHTYSTRMCLPRIHDLFKPAQAPLGHNRQHLQF